MYPFAIGKCDTVMQFQQGSDELGATSRVIENAEGGEKVTVRSVGSLLEKEKLSLPNFVKIDVEGFEYDVLSGFGPHLGNHSLKALGIEVHFGLLRERGLSDAPAAMEEMLKEAGFHLSWPDPSHILAVRRS